jgi:hypothetical protein
MRWLMALLAVLGLSAPVSAQGNTPFERRAVQLVDVLKGTLPADRFFAVSFLNEIPASQIAEIARQLESQHGTLTGLAATRPEGPANGEVDLNYQRAVVTMQLVVGQQLPSMAIGLLVTKVSVRGDGWQLLERDYRALPGRSTLFVANINRQVEPLISLNGSEQFAIGSTFKLWPLAEAARQVQAGKRRWSDVVPLGAPSFPSGISQDWPKSAPMTLHTLATLAISISDNSATDSLMDALGRSAVDQQLVDAGHTSPGSTLPLLKTVEAFWLKTSAAASDRARWINGSLKDRRALINQMKASISRIDRTTFGDKPAFINDVEWFASGQDVARLFATIRATGSKEAMDILAINRPLPKATQDRFRYVGYKGGSEPGVMSMSFLLQRKDGSWLVVTGSWNNPVAAVNERLFEGLMQRAVDLVR